MSDMKRSGAPWRGVFPAVTTQFHDDLSIDFEATATNVARLIEEGVHGIVALGTCGENNSLTADEKRAALRAIIEAAAGRVPVLSGVSEFTTRAACDFAKEASEIGADGLMVLPAMVYSPNDQELIAHFSGVAGASDLPIMLYNNPAAYGVEIAFRHLEILAGIDTIVCIKESSEDIRRITDLYNEFGDRFILFAGLDDVALEAIAMGAQGWVSGLTNAFPKESLAIWDLMQRGELEEARAIYRWFAPLLHLDARPDLVQCIKLSEQIMGRGAERTRAPRLALSGETREQVVALVERARDSRPPIT